MLLKLLVIIFCYKIVYANGLGGCYYASSYPENWFDALTICQMLGRCLASINTPEMYATLTAHLTRDTSLRNVEFWSGLNSYEKNTFAYVENGTIGNYMPPGVTLKPQHPCVFVKSKGKSKLLMESTSCSKKKRFLCADTFGCNARLTQIHHSLALRRRIEKANNICASLNEDQDSQKKILTKTRSGTNSIGKERKKRNEDLWMKLTQEITNDTNYS